MSGEGSGGTAESHQGLKIDVIFTYMKQLQMDVDSLQHLTELAYFQINEYSQTETLKNMAEAKRELYNI